MSMRIVLVLLLLCGAAQASPLPLSGADQLNADVRIRQQLMTALHAADPVKSALTTYRNLYGSLFQTTSFADMVGGGGLMPGSPTKPGSFWNMLGFSTTPALPLEVSALYVDARTGDISIALTSIQPDIDNTVVVMHAVIINRRLNWFNTCNSSSYLVREVFSC